MTENCTNQFTEYLVREVARRIVTMALDVAGTSSCIAQAKKLRGLPDNASMAEVGESCTDAANTARAAAADVRVNWFAADTADHAAGEAARAARASVAALVAAEAALVAGEAAHVAGEDGEAGNANASGVAYSAYVAAGAHSTYSDILMEAAKRLHIGDVPIIPDLHRKMYAAVTLPGQSLEMGVWHTCATTHCRAGWAVVLGGAAGKELEKAFGPAVAGGLIYACNTGMVPNFYDTDNESVMADMKLAAQAS